MTIDQRVLRISRPSTGGWSFRRARYGQRLQKSDGSSHNVEQILIYPFDFDSPVGSAPSGIAPCGTAPLRGRPPSNVSGLESGISYTGRHHMFESMRDFIDDREIA